MDAILMGTRELAGITSLDLSVRNGTVTCAEADLPEGVVHIEWEYGGKDIDRADPANFELRFKQDGPALEIVDWHDNGSSLLNKLNVKLDLRLQHGPGVNLLDFSHGNGTLSYTGSAHGDFSMGNGTLQLAGEPDGDIDVSLGNGKIRADWLLTGGNCDVSIGNGSANVELRGGSGVTMDGSVGIGSITAPSGIKVTRSHMLGANAVGSLGDGAARMDISIGNGSIRIEQV